MTFLQYTAQNAPATNFARMHRNRSTEFPRERSTSTSVDEGKDVVSRRNLFQRKRNLQKLSIPIELTVNATVLPSGATQWLLIIADPF